MDIINGTERLFRWIVRIEQANQQKLADDRAKIIAIARRLTEALETLAKDK